MAEWNNCDRIPQSPKCLLSAYSQKKSKKGNILECYVQRRWERCLVTNLDQMCPGCQHLAPRIETHTHVYHPTPSKVLCKDTEDEKNNSTEKFAAELPGYCLGLLEEGCGASLFEWKLGLCELLPIMHVLSCDASDFNSIHAQLCIGIRSYIGVFL